MHFSSDYLQLLSKYYLINPSNSPVTSLILWIKNHSATLSLPFLALPQRPQGRHPSPSPLERASSN
jgi:hypothetical protein